MVGSVVLVMPVLLALGGESDGRSLDGLPPVPTAATATATAASPEMSADRPATPQAAPPVEVEPATPAESASASADTAVRDAVTEPAVVTVPAERVEVPCALDYTVVEGDYWLRLADASGAPLRDLLAVNAATIDTALYPGDQICLPPGSTVPAPPPPTASPSPAAPPSSGSSGTRTTPTTNAPAPAPSPTTPPTTAAPPTTAPPSPSAVQAIIREVWPDDLEDRAIEIAARESNFLTTAKNWCCVGLFQIYWDVHKGWLDDLGVTSATQLYDARTNATAAYHLYLRSGGWGPWG